VVVPEPCYVELEIGDPERWRALVELWNEVGRLKAEDELDSEAKAGPRWSRRDERRASAAKSSATLGRNRHCRRGKDAALRYRSRVEPRLAAERTLDVLAPSIEGALPRVMDSLLAGVACVVGLGQDERIQHPLGGHRRAAGAIRRAQERLERGSKWSLVAEHGTLDVVVIVHQDDLDSLGLDVDAIRIELDPAFPGVR
jgi:hypothetical protein